MNIFSLPWWLTFLEVWISYQHFILCIFSAPKYLREPISCEVLCQFHVLCGISVLYKTAHFLTYADKGSFPKLLEAYLETQTTAVSTVPWSALPSITPLCLIGITLPALSFFVSLPYFNLFFVKPIPFQVSIIEKCHMDLSLGGRR